MYGVQLGRGEISSAIPSTVASPSELKRANRKGSKPGQNNMLERVMGIEPTSSAWKAAALPLSYTRIISCSLQLVEGVGFEPT